MDYCTILTCPEMYFDSDGVIFLFTFALVGGTATVLYHGVKYIVNKIQK